MFKYIFTLPFALVLFFSCKKNNPNESAHKIRINTIPKYQNNGTEPIKLDSIYTTPEGYLIKFTDVKFYLSRVVSDSREISMACLFDLRNSQYKLVDTLGTSDGLSSISGNIGIDSLLNHSDPTMYSNESPLNISNAGLMHWSWNMGYIFINIEGKLDTIPDGIELLDHNFSFHVGSDDYIQAFEIQNLEWNELGDSLSESNLVLDLYELFHGSNPIDLKTEYFSHSAAGQENLAIKIAQNFKNSFSK